MLSDSCLVRHPKSRFCVSTLSFFSASADLHGSAAQVVPVSTSTNVLLREMSGYDDDHDDDNDDGDENSALIRSCMRTLLRISSCNSNNHAWICCIS